MPGLSRTFWWPPMARSPSVGARGRPGAARERYVKGVEAAEAGDFVNLLEFARG
jgi:hypothetical protein